VDQGLGKIAWVDAKYPKNIKNCVVVDSDVSNSLAMISAI